MTSEVQWFAYVASHRHEDPIGSQHFVPSEETSIGDLSIRPTSHYYTHLTNNSVHPFNNSTPLGATVLLTEVEGSSPPIGDRVKSEALHKVVDSCAAFTVLTGTPWRVYGRPSLHRHNGGCHRTQLESIPNTDALVTLLLSHSFPISPAKLDIPQWTGKTTAPDSPHTQIAHTIYMAVLAESISPSLSLTALFTAIDGCAKLALKGAPSRFNQQDRIRSAIELVRPSIQKGAREVLLRTRNALTHDNIFSETDFWRNAWQIADRQQGLTLLPSNSAYLHYALVLPEIRDIARDLLSHSLGGNPLTETRADQAFSGPPWK